MSKDKVKMEICNIEMWEHSSVVEHSTADREVSGSSPDVLYHLHEKTFFTHVRHTKSKLLASNQNKSSIYTKEQMSVIEDSSAEHQLSIEHDMIRLVSVMSSFAQPTCVSKNLYGDLFL